MNGLQKEFTKLFPLAPVETLPAKADEIGAFLAKRIPLEVEAANLHMVRQVGRVLCEISPPKTHLVDMARIVVEHARERDHYFNDAKNLRVINERLKAEADELRQKLVKELRAKNEPEEAAA